MDEEFAKFPVAWFGRHPYKDQDSLSSCLWTAGWYVIDYHNVMLQAKKADLIHNTYRIEDTSPCQVAEMAGFWKDAVDAVVDPDDEFIINIDEFEDGNIDGNNTIWPPIRQRVKQTCRRRQDDQGNKKQPHHEPMTSTSYRVNRGRVALGPSNFTDDLRVLWDELAALTQELGYATSTTDDDNDDHHGAKSRANDGDL